MREDEYKYSWKGKYKQGKCEKEIKDGEKFSYVIIFKGNAEKRCFKFWCGQKKEGSWEGIDQGVIEYDYVADSITENYKHLFQLLKREMHDDRAGANKECLSITYAKSKKKLTISNMSFEDYVGMLFYLVSQLQKSLDIWKSELADQKCIDLVERLDLSRRQVVRACEEAERRKLVVDSRNAARSFYQHSMALKKKMEEEERYVRFFREMMRYLVLFAGCEDEPQCQDISCDLINTYRRTEQIYRKNSKLLEALRNEKLETFHILSWEDPVWQKGDVLLDEGGKYIEELVSKISDLRERLRDGGDPSGLESEVERLEKAAKSICNLKGAIEPDIQVERVSAERDRFIASGKAVNKEVNLELKKRDYIRLLRQIDRKNILQKVFPSEEEFNKTFGGEFPKEFCMEICDQLHNLLEDFNATEDHALTFMWIMPTDELVRQYKLMYEFMGGDARYPGLYARGIAEDDQERPVCVVNGGAFEI